LPEQGLHRGILGTGSTLLPGPNRVTAFLFPDGPTPLRRLFFLLGHALRDLLVCLLNLAQIGSDGLDIDGGLWQARLAKARLQLFGLALNILQRALPRRNVED
jgi:hypothetical protein